MTALPTVEPAGEGRRAKAVLFLSACGVAGAAPHWLDPPRNLLPAFGLTLVLGLYLCRTVFLPLWQRRGPQLAPDASALNAPPATEASWPSVDVVVAARDEQAVITRLVERVQALRYPRGSLRLWVVDDGSEDRTAELLEELERRTPQLTVLRRPRDAGGGKSGALNAVLERLRGRWMLVLDADAGLQGDLLERAVGYAESGVWSAVQLRKAVVNADTNLLTRAQAMEMALDAVVQEGRLQAGGVVELRGNGQLLRRDALLACGGFNEATITDDLDLSFRLLLAGEPIGVLWDPPVAEEAVLTLRSLWRQRQRWAEGGLQRFFDYWPGLFSSRLTGRQRLDLGCFFVIQYALPVMASADLISSILTRTPPTVWPLSILTLGLSATAIVAGCRRPGEGPALPRIHPISLAGGILYLVHWFVVIPWVVLRMALLPKRLVWAKTLHLGANDVEEDRLQSEPDLSTQAS